MALITLQQTGIKRYIAILNQSGVDAPVHTIMFNEIGEATWTRTAQGIFTVQFAGIVLNTFKTFFSLSFGNTDTLKIFTFGRSSGGRGRIEQTDFTGVFVDGIINASVEIKVFN